MLHKESGLGKTWGNDAIYVWLAWGLEVFMESFLISVNFKHTFLKMLQYVTWLVSISLLIPSSLTRPDHPPFGPFSEWKFKISGKSLLNLK